MSYLFEIRLKALGLGQLPNAYCGSGSQSDSNTIHHEAEHYFVPYSKVKLETALQKCCSNYGFCISAVASSLFVFRGFYVATGLSSPTMRHILPRGSSVAGSTERLLGSFLSSKAHN
jgi:hypothetical protein